jgi:hypothetical protein
MVLACAAPATAQPTHEWSRSFVHMDHGLWEGNVFHGLRMDSQQNTYWFSCVAGTVDMDPGPDTTAFFAPVGYTYGDAVIAKFDSTGALVWARHFNTGSNFFYIADLALDESAGVFAICGQYHGDQDIDPGPDTVDLPTATTLYSGFVALFDTAGNHLSHMNYAVGSLSAARCTALGFLPDHSLLVAGHYYGALDIDPNGTTNLPSASWSPFLARYSVPFVLEQYFPITGCSGFIKDIEVLANGNVALVGEGTGLGVDFDPSPSNSATNVGLANTGAFYALYTGALELVWAKGHWSAAATIQAQHLCGDAVGDVYISGYYAINNSSISFDLNPTSGVESNIYYLHSQQLTGRYLIKFAASGSYQWGRMLQGAASGMNAFAGGEGQPVAMNGMVMVSHWLSDGQELPLTMRAGGADLLQYPVCTTEPNSKANYIIGLEAGTGAVLWVVRDTLHCAQGDQDGATLAGGPGGVLMLNGYFTDTLNAAMGQGVELVADSASGFNDNGYLSRFLVPDLSTPVNEDAGVGQALEGTPIERRVFDTQGRLVREDRHPDRVMGSQPCPALPPGIYVVEERFTSGARHTRRIHVDL